MQVVVEGDRDGAVLRTSGRRVIGAARRGETEHHGEREREGARHRRGLFRMLCRASCAGPIPAARGRHRRRPRGVRVRHRGHLAVQERPELRGRRAVRRALLGLPHAGRRRRRGLGDQGQGRASARTARTSISARRTSTDVLYAIGTAASPARSCRRTSSIGEDARTGRASFVRQVLRPQQTHAGRQPGASTPRPAVRSARPQRDPPRSRSRSGRRWRAGATAPTARSTTCSRSTRGAPRAAARARGRCGRAERRPREAIARGQAGGRGRDEAIAAMQRGRARG